MELTAIFLSTTMQVRGRGWRRLGLRRPARVERGETFSGWRENGALALGLDFSKGAPLLDWSRGGMRCKK